MKEMCALLYKVRHLKNKNTCLQEIIMPLYFYFKYIYFHWLHFLFNFKKNSSNLYF